MRNWTGWRLLAVVALLALGCRAGLAQSGARHVLALPGAGQDDGPGLEQERGSIAVAQDGQALIRFHGLRVMAHGALGREADQGAALWPAAELASLADLAVLAPAPSTPTAPPVDGRDAAASAGQDAAPPVAAVQDQDATPPAVRMPARLAAGPLASPVPLVYAASPHARQGNPQAQLHPLQAFDTLSLRKGKVRLRVTALPGRPGMAAVGGFLLEIGTVRASCRIYFTGAALAPDELGALAQSLPGADLALYPDGARLRVAALPRGGQAGGRDRFDGGRRAAGAGAPLAQADGGYTFGLVRR